MDRQPPGNECSPSARQPLAPIAHVTKDLSRQHGLSAHLLGTTNHAIQFATAFNASNWAELAARWHDLGKYRQAFQHYIRGVSGFEAHLIDSYPNKPNHSSAGALYATKTIPGPPGMALAFLIAGHHAGLANWSGELDERLKPAQRFLLDEALSADIPADIRQAPTTLPPPAGGSAGFHLWIRMLYSCLVDADFLDTESFFEQDKATLRGNPLCISDLLTSFNRYMADKQKQAKPSPVNTHRADVLRQCREKAHLPPGIFTLTVPTGGGKTLSGLAFALEHAKANQQRRVIFAIPYTSIIEQTAEVFREVFRELPHAVLEHHSNFDPDKETPESRLATENWDAPLVVTTNVQLFESLFANRSNRCRKLHNIANSVIVLDEAQLLPPAFLQPMLDIMRLLVEHYGVTFVLCTATQPALGSRQDVFGKTHLRGLDHSTKIIDDEATLYQALERVDFEFPPDLNQRQTWEALADELTPYEQVLVIVNTRRDCRALHALMPAGTIHLSALMCGEHRSQVIADIRQRLHAGLPVRVVSTQLIECGVDADFPVVYRAMAGFDSLAQAAGRCNREGKLPGKGRVKIFLPPQLAPRGLLRFGEQAACKLLPEHRGTTLKPGDFAAYFDTYYSQIDTFDSKQVQHLLNDPRDLRFRDAAEAFRLIADEDTISLIVPYTRPDGASSLDDIALLRKGIVFRELQRRLQRFTVSVRKKQVGELLRHGEINEPVSGYFVLETDKRYHPELGLLWEEDVFTTEDFML